MFNFIQQHNLKVLAALICFVNIVVLSNVFYNRMGEPFQITLTERELSIPRGNNLENSGLNLTINYRVPTSDVKLFVGGYKIPDWLTREKMLSLGFNETALAPVEKELGNKRQTAKEAFVALEYDGDSYRKMVQVVKQWADLQPTDENTLDKSINKRVQNENVEASRLFVVDANLDLARLKEKYRDKSSIFFAKAIIRPVNFTNYQGTTFGPGAIESLSISRINLPNPFNLELAHLPPEDYNIIEPPRYEVDVSIGKSLEPWVTAIREL